MRAGCGSDGSVPAILNSVIQTSREEVLPGVEQRGDALLGQLVQVPRSAEEASEEVSDVTEDDENHVHVVSEKGNKHIRLHFLRHAVDFLCHESAYRTEESK